MAANREDNSTYQCPNCDGEMTLAGGSLTQFVPFFRHKPGEACHEYPDRQGEGEIHEDAKCQIEANLREIDWATDVDTEHLTGSAKPDVFFRCDGIKYGVEIQVSSITATELLERTRARTEEGIHTLWLFHDSLYADVAPSESTLRFLTGQQAWRSMLTEEACEIWIPIYGPTFVTRGVLGSAWHVSLYDDMNAGRTTRTTATNKPVPFTGRDGLLLAVGERTSKYFQSLIDDRKDENEAESEGILDHVDRVNGGDRSD